MTLLTGLSEKTITGLSDDELMDCADLVREFLEGCEKYIPQWGDMVSGKIAASDVRENFVIGHAVFLEALGMFGREALFYGTHLSPQEKNAKVIDPGKAKWHVLRPLNATTVKDRRHVGESVRGIGQNAKDGRRDQSHCRSDAFDCQHSYAGIAGRIAPAHHQVSTPQRGA